jgi:alkaline phosphatase D
MADDPSAVGTSDSLEEPTRSDDHVQLLSKLDSQDLALAMDAVEASDASVFEFDADAAPDGTFPQSVASGGPTPTGVTLRTHVAPAAFDPERLLAVQVAGSADLESVVYDGVASRTGHCRTLPRPDADPELVSFAVLTCQNYLNGYFAALHHVAEEHRA